MSDEMHCGPGCTCAHHATAVAAALLITINPEARVDVARTADPLPRFPLGEWVPIAVANQGYVTGPLDCWIEQGDGVEVAPLPHRLTGRDQQMELGVRLVEPGPRAVTLRFAALGALGGLADHSTIPLVLGMPDRHQHAHHHHEEPHHAAEDHRSRTP